MYQRDILVYDYANKLVLSMFFFRSEKYSGNEKMAAKKISGRKKWIFKNAIMMTFKKIRKNYFKYLQ
jgi:hypothetical protein